MPVKSLIGYLCSAAVVISIALYFYIYSADRKGTADFDRTLRLKWEIISLRSKLGARENAHAGKLELSLLKRDLGRLYLADRSYKQAEACFIGSLNEVRGINGEVESAKLLEIADFYRLWRRFSLADAFYRAALIGDRQSGGDRDNMIGRDLNNLAVLHLVWAESIASASASERHFEQAKNWLKQAKQLTSGKSPLLSRLVSNNFDQVLAEEKLKK